MPGGIPVRLGKSGLALNSLRIENNQIRKISPLQHPAAINPEVLRGQCRELSDCLLQFQYLLLARVSAQRPGVAAAGFRVRTALEKDLSWRMDGESEQKLTRGRARNLRRLSSDCVK